MSPSDYQGIKTLENLKEAVNYNDFIEGELVEFIGQSRSVLDFGAGSGEFAERLNSDEINVDCVETDKELAAKLTVAGFKVFAAIAESDKKYEKIYSLNVLEHIEDDSKALSEIRAQLTDDGMIFIYVPAFMLLYSKFDKKIGHFRRYTKHKLTHKISGAGFEVMKSEYADSLGFFAWLVLKLFVKDGGEPNRKLIKVYDKFFFPLSRIMDIFFHKLFGKNLLVIARKV